MVNCNSKEYAIFEGMDRPRHRPYVGGHPARKKRWLYGRTDTLHEDKCSDRSVLLRPDHTLQPIERDMINGE